MGWNALGAINVSGEHYLRNLVQNDSLFASQFPFFLSMEGALKSHVRYGV